MMADSDEESGPVSFSEDFTNDEDEGEGETERGEKGFVTVSNATSLTLYIEFQPIELVRRAGARAFKVGAGLDVATVGANVKVAAGSVAHELSVMDTRKQTVYSHVSFDIPLPNTSISTLHKEKAALLHNSLFARIYHDGPDDSLVEVGRGFSLGVGHGIIVSKPRGFKVEEVAKRRWFKSFNPWTPKGGSKGSKDPHRDLKMLQECKDCGEVISRK